MKKIILLTITLSITLVTDAQTNTLPTTGKVGIGTSTPSEALDVNGNLIVDSCLIVKDSVLIEKDLRTKGKFVVEDESTFLQKVYMNDELRVVGKIHTDDNLRVGNNIRVDNRLRVDGNTVLNGNVKMTALSQLNDLSNPNIELLFKMPSGQVKSSSWIDLQDAILELVYKEDCYSGDITNPTWANGLNKLYSLCPQVKVGIGKSQPIHRFDVRGTAFSTKILAGNVNAISNAIINGFAPNNSWNLIQLGQKIGSNAEQIRFRISNDGEMEISNTGSQPSLAINNGTGYAVVIKSNNGEKILQLEDNGMLRSRRIKVDADTWADYVYKPGYYLMSLKQTENFIKENGHLPNIPTAKEIEKNGLDIGEMQTLQMEKIEELYIHLFEMSDKITELENKIIELQK